MLGFTFKEMHETPPGPEWNIAFEAFCIHARNLYDFLRHEGNKNTTYRADDYVHNHSKSEAELLFNNLDTFLFHMSTGRIDKKKVDLADVQKLGKWLDEHWSTWVSSLEDRFATLVDAKAVCNQCMFSAGVSETTACTYFTTTSVTPVDTFSSNGFVMRS